MIGNNFHRVYISFGSNKGNRLENIIISLKEIEVQLGRIEKISNLYLTKSWGFKSRDFYNGCLILITKFSPSIVLRKIKSIENSLGRIKSFNGKYFSREIDIDILFFDDLIINSQELKIPHKQIHKRKFVLIPMLDLSPELIHPESKHSISQLLNKSNDELEVRKIKNDKYYIPFWDKYSFISIEGNIGVGKTTLSKSFKSHFNVELLNENFKKNPFLIEFYQNPRKFSLKAEKFFLKDRVNQINSHFLISKNTKTISDFWIGKSLVFAKNNLSKGSFEKFVKNFEKHNSNLRSPEIIIYLKQTTSRLKKQIIKRGRSFEMEISNEYLNSISNEYELIFSKKINFILIVLEPQEVLKLKNEQVQENLYRRLINL